MGTGTGTVVGYEIVSQYSCVYIDLMLLGFRQGPYHDDSTASRLLSEVKHRRAWLVLRWGATLESRVLSFTLFFAFTLLP